MVKFIFKVMILTLFCCDLECETCGGVNVHYNLYKLGNVFAKFVHEQSWLQLVLNLSGRLLITTNDTFCVEVTMPLL